MGGHEAGEVASAMVVDALGSLVPQARLADRIDSAIAALGQVNGALVDMVASGSAGHGRAIGTTVVGLGLAEGGYEIFWAGDSRVYLLRGRSLTQLTRDHSLVADLVDAGMLSEAEAATHPDANVITRAVGAAPHLRLDRKAGEVRSGDLFLLCSDGLTRVVSDAEIASTLLAMNPMQASSKLIAQALDRGAPDNVTLIIVRLA